MIIMNLIYLCVAVVTVLGLLRLLDLLNGGRFKTDVYPIIKSNPLALALYRASWVIGVCILASGMLGT